MQINTSRKYVWSKREATDEGSPIVSVIEQVTNDHPLYVYKNYCGF